MENFLPAEITLDILSRLPMRSVLECKLVCRTWRILLLAPYFALMHLQFSVAAAAASTTTMMGILCLIEIDAENGNGHRSEETKSSKVGLYYREYDENNGNSYKTLKKIKHPPIDFSNALVGSCNGLICISYTQYTHNIHDSFYICNPITREYVNLPRSIASTIKDDFGQVRMASGFGYLSSTNEYKVVRIYYHRNQPSIGQVQVYTVGDGRGWRSKGEITYQIRHHSRLVSIGKLANGALHWKDDIMPGKIISFDLAEEKFRLLPSPPCLGYYGLKVLGGCLCVVNHDGFKHRYNIWVLRSNDWEFMLSIAISNEDLYFKPFILTNRGEILFWQGNTDLFCYDSRTRKLVELDISCLPFEQAIPHMHSFVSLRSLGEDDVKKIEFGKEELMTKRFV